MTLAVCGSLPEALVGWRSKRWMFVYPKRDSHLLFEDLPMRKHPRCIPFHFPACIASCPWENKTVSIIPDKETEDRLPSFLVESCMCIFAFSVAAATTTTPDFLWKTRFQNSCAWNGQWFTPSAVGGHHVNALGWTACPGPSALIPASAAWKKMRGTVKVRATSQQRRFDSPIQQTNTSCLWQSVSADALQKQQVAGGY